MGFIFFVLPIPSLQMKYQVLLLFFLHFLYFYLVSQWSLSISGVQAVLNVMPPSLLHLGCGKGDDQTNNLENHQVLNDTTLHNDNNCS